jgi:hypothetical protein
MRIVTLDENKKIIGIKDVGELYTMQSNDVNTLLGLYGQIQQEDGSFIDDTTPVIPPVIQPTNQEIKDFQMVIMNGLTDIYMATLGL